jgi:putative transcriptional regulator
MDQFSVPNLQAGRLLLATPFLNDANFVRSVILICEHEDQGSIGFVINKPSILNLGDLVKELNFLKCEVFVGGPVEQNTLHFIYFGSQQLIPDSKPLADDIWWGGDFSTLVHHLKSHVLDVDQVRFFLGYSGWDQGQLEAELAEDTWVVYSEAPTSTIFESSSDQIWRLLMKGMGGEFEIQANYPIDPRLN